ncbi:hypothetical protein CROQUDRAFT_131113 [Cronartium quercuum f. sp. fusiforme G11]|uniref:Uncharacterized protein n=1 Tax=Cronartium quercuum f. sp. fusiforme G11 TaxID=708437 RepID=A0A9P6NMA1_9BASI|nr:hypothetical protein CROQUDRAFT_131113 [Cronartium quercuum f. sp. fusiforme G11]
MLVPDALENVGKNLRALDADRLEADVSKRTAYIPDSTKKGKGLDGKPPGKTTGLRSALRFTCKPYLVPDSPATNSSSGPSTQGSRQPKEKMLSSKDLNSNYAGEMNKVEEVNRAAAAKISQEKEEKIIRQNATTEKKRQTKRVREKRESQALQKHMTRVEESQRNSTIPKEEKSDEASDEELEYEELP